MPRLSIVIPSYNYAQYLPEAIDSVLLQDYTDYELILVDDYSTDSSPNICAEYASHHSHIQHVQHPKNLGLYHSILSGFENCSGDYIHYFSADDRYLPGFISKSMAFLESHPQAEVVCTDLGYFQDGSSHLDEKRLLPGLSEPCFFSKNDISDVFRSTSFWVTGASCIASRELIVRYGPHIPQLENLSDWYYFHKMALYEGIGYIPEVLTSMRVHEHTLTNQVKRNKKRRRATFHHLLKVVAKDKELCERFMRAGLLDFVFRDLKWKIYLNPRYRRFWFR